MAAAEHMKLVGETPEERLAAQMEAAIAAGADISDLQAIMAEEKGVEFDEVGQPVVVEQAGEGEEPEKRPLRNIMEFAGGVMEEALRTANWLLGLRKDVNAEISEVRAAAAAEMAPIKAWEDREVKRLERRLDWMDWLLLGFHRQTSEKKVSRPNGDLAWEKARDSIAWDMDKALKFVFDQAWAIMATKGQAAAQEFLAAHLDIKKTPVKELLTKQLDGTYTYLTAEGEKITVISVEQTGVVPCEPRPLDDPEAEIKPLAWVKPGETYLQKIKQ